MDGSAGGRGGGWCRLVRASVVEAARYRGAVSDSLPPFESTQVTRLRFSPVLWLAPLIGGFWPLVLKPLLRWIAPWFDRGTRPFVALGFLAAWFVFLGVAIARGARSVSKRREELGALRVDGEGVRWNGALIRRRKAIATGVVLPRLASQSEASRARVRLSPPFGLITEFGVADEHEGRAVLRALGLDASQTAVRFFFNSRFAPRTYRANMIVGAFVGVGVVATMVVAHVVPHFRPFAIALAVPVFAAAVAISIPTRALVGTDGILVRQLGTTRYIAYRAIDRLEMIDAGVIVIERNGAATRLERTVAGKVGRELMRAERDAFVTRVEQARAASSTPSTRVDPAAVARREQSAAEWIASLRALVHAEGGMRTAPIVRDQLFDLVGDARLDAASRAGAAAAMGLARVATDRARLRVMAATTAQPKLRVVIEAAANGDEEALRDALDAVRDAANPRRAT